MTLIAVAGQKNWAQVSWPPPSLDFLNHPRDHKMAVRAVLVKNEALLLSLPFRVLPNMSVKHVNRKTPLRKTVQDTVYSIKPIKTGG